VRIISEQETNKPKKKKRVRRRINYKVIGVLTVVAVVIGISLAFQLNTVQRRVVYPYPYRETVRHYAEKYGVDSNLAAAVIKAESKFEHTAKSYRGALGLMQIMPDTGDWIADQLDEDNYSNEILLTPETNIRYGVWYLSTLAREFKNNEVLTLAAYNAGRGNVHAWMEEYGWDYDFGDVDAIPFAETREYVRRVLKHKNKYYELYR